MNYIEEDFEHLEGIGLRCMRSVNAFVPIRPFWASTRCFSFGASLHLPCFSAGNREISKKSREPIEHERAITVRELGT